MPKVTISVEIDTDNSGFDLEDDATPIEIADFIADDLTKILRYAEISATVTPTHVDGESLGNS